MALIINADDFGLSPEVNSAIDICFKHKWINQASIIVNMPDFTKAVDLAVRNGYLYKIGFHLNIVEGIPLTEDIKGTFFCNEFGYFNPIWMKKIKNKFILNETARKALKIEIEAQIMRYIKAGFTLMHMDSHMHTHINYSIFSVLMDVLYNHGFKSIRLARNIQSTNISIIKYFYKMYINRQLHKFNSRDITYRKIKYFLGYKDYLLLDNFDNAEIMIHPVIVNGVITDSTADLNSNCNLIDILNLMSDKI